MINYEAFCRTSQEKQFIKGCIDPADERIPEAVNIKYLDL